MKLIECVPNFSEGRNKSKIDNIVAKIKENSNVTILDVDMGFDTNRTVITIVGSPHDVLEGVFHGIKKASEIIDMRKHTGTHPRIGSTDVCPIIPIKNVSEAEGIALSLKLGKRIGEELGIPIYLYEKSSNLPYRKKLPDIRLGEYEGLEKKLSSKKWIPDFGPGEMNYINGATIVGCRDFLIAYNINLNTRNARIATDIAFELREAGRSKRIPNPLSNNLLDGKIVRDASGKAVKVPGKFKDVKGIGWYVTEFDQAQISINFNNYKISTIHEVYDEANRLATERGLIVTGSELVGLIPLDALLMAGKYYLQKQQRPVGLPESDIIDTAIQSLGLDNVVKFNKNEKIIEYAIKKQKRNLISMQNIEFIDELSRNSPAPGGGTASALAGALGASLASMVSVLSYDKKELIKNRNLYNELGEGSQLLKDKLSLLIDEDTEAFNAVVDANRLPSSTKKEISRKNNQILIANKNALEIPLKTAKLSFKILELLSRLVEFCNPNSISDLGVASELAIASVKGAYMNVLINTKSIQDKKYCSHKLNEADRVVQNAEKIYKLIYKKVVNIIKS